VSTPAPVDWVDYYDGTAGRPVRDLLVRALEAFGPPSPGAVAVDLGCGDGTETVALLRAGFTVAAMDSSPEAIRRTTARAASELGSDASRLTTTVAGLETYVVPPADLVYAGFSLPFCPPFHFPALWARIRAALNPGAVLAVTLFGEHDSWASDRDKTFLSAARVAELTAGLDEVVVTEDDSDGAAYSGPKHWHLFEALARQPR
jgi:trans-aconitate methyltransferase